MNRNLFLFLFFLLVLIFTIQPPFDLDLGWHLRYGQYFFQTGHVLKDNILSYVWPDYKWVQASWGYDLIAYQLFNHFSFWGMSLFAGIITALTFIIVVFPLSRLNIWSLSILVVVFLTQTNQMYIAGLRSVTLSILFFALTFVISSSYLKKSSKKYDGLIYLLPLLFLVWANLHGAFSLGLGVLAILWISFGILKLVGRKKWLIFGLMLILSFLTPLLNPWGLRIYEETFKHSSNTNLTLIKEWTPFIKWPTEAAISFSIIFLVLILGWVRKRISDIPYLLVLILLSYLSFSALKFVTFLGVVLTFYLAQIFKEDQIPFFKQKYIRWGLAAIFLSLFTLDILFFQKFVQLPNPNIFNYSWNEYCQDVENCSEGITQIMLKDPPKGEGFNPYGMGGYLIYRVPQVKVFVDGRMAAWEENGQTPPIKDAATLNSPYSPIIFKKLDSQYHFSWVIINNNSPIILYLDQLVKSGTLKKLFQDNLYSYFIKPKNELD